MKRLLHITAQRPEKTGSGTYLQAMMREADGKDYEQAFVAAINQGEEFVFRGDHGITFYPVYFQTEELPFSIAGMTDMMPYESTKYSDMTDDMLQKWKNAFRLAVTRAVEEFRPDAIICHHLWILTAYVRELFPDMTIAAICHGTDLRQLVLAERFAGYVREGCSRLDLAFALNEYQKERISREYGIAPERVHVIGSGYNAYIFHREDCKVNMDSVELVYAGKLNRSKGVVSLIRALDGLDFYSKKIRLTIAGTGKGPEAEAIFAAARECRHEVVFTGDVTQESLSRIFRDSDIFILPSFYEGLPLVLIEAMASGLRVVTTDLPGVKGWIGMEINSSGIIEYVDMPQMESIDSPFESELPGFEKRLGEAIETQFNRMLKHENADEDFVYESIKKLSWSGVFETIENILSKTIELKR